MTTHAEIREVHTEQRQMHGAIYRGIVTQKEKMQFDHGGILYLPRFDTVSQISLDMQFDKDW